MSADTLAMVAKWHEATTERERAAIEWAIWSKVPRGARPKAGAPAYLAPILQSEAANTARIKCRVALHLAGEAADPLWNRVDARPGAARMSVRSAADMVAHARLRARAEAVGLDEAVRRELADYDRLPVVTQLPSGAVVRKRRMRRRRDAILPPRPGRSSKRMNIGARQRWAALRAAWQRIVDVELSGVPAAARARFQEQGEAELRQLLELLGGRIRRYRETAHLDAPIVRSPRDERAELKSACAMLAIDPPPRGQHVDHATCMKAKKNYRKLVAEYHPDHHTGLEGEALKEIERQFDAVRNAFLIIEQDYQKRNEAKPTRGANAHGADDDHE